MACELKEGRSFGQDPYNNTMQSAIADSPEHTYADGYLSQFRGFEEIQHGINVLVMVGFFRSGSGGRGAVWQHGFGFLLVAEAVRW